MLKMMYESEKCISYPLPCFINYSACIGKIVHRPTHFHDSSDRNMRIRFLENSQKLLESVSTSTKNRIEFEYILHIIL